MVFRHTYQTPFHSSGFRNSVTIPSVSYGRSISPYQSWRLPLVTPSLSKSRTQDSNLRHVAPYATALPPELERHINGEYCNRPSPRRVDQLDSFSLSLCVSVHSPAFNSVIFNLALRKGQVELLKTPNPEYRHSSFRCRHPTSTLGPRKHFTLWQCINYLRGSLPHEASNPYKRILKSSSTLLFFFDNILYHNFLNFSNNDEIFNCMINIFFRFTPKLIKLKSIKRTKN